MLGKKGTRTRRAYMSSDVIPFGGLVIYFLRNSPISVLIGAILIPEDYSILPMWLETMQKNAFHEIWTLLSRTFLQGEHAVV